MENKILVIEGQNRIGGGQKITKEVCSILNKNII